ncbi:MAG: hypothetical protein ACPGSC_11530, partial [Granulosicoccaceae bacterium]
MDEREGKLAFRDLSQPVQAEYAALEAALDSTVMDAPTGVSARPRVDDAQTGSTGNLDETLDSTIILTQDETAFVAHENTTEMLDSEELERIDQLDTADELLLIQIEQPVEPLVSSPEPLPEKVRDEFADFEQNAPEPPRIGHLQMSLPAQTPVSASEQVQPNRLFSWAGLLHTLVSMALGAGIVVAYEQAQPVTPEATFVQPFVEPVVAEPTSLDTPALSAGVKLPSTDLEQADVLSSQSVDKLAEQDLELPRLNAALDLEESAERSGVVEVSALDLPIPLPEDLALVRSVPSPLRFLENQSEQTATAQQMVKDIQWRLFKLGLFNGLMSGEVNEVTVVAIRAFYIAHPQLAEPANERQILRDLDQTLVS